MRIHKQRKRIIIIIVAVYNITCFDLARRTNEYLRHRARRMGECGNTQFDSHTIA